MFNPTKILTLAQFDKTPPTGGLPDQSNNDLAANERAPLPDSANDAPSSAAGRSQWSYYVFKQGRLELRGIDQ